MLAARHLTLLCAAWDGKYSMRHRGLRGRCQRSRDGRASMIDLAISELGGSQQRPSWRGTTIRGGRRLWW